MGEEQILLHTFRSTEEVRIDGGELQRLLQHKNSLLRTVHTLEDTNLKLREALETLSNKLDSILIKQPLKATKVSLGTYFDSQG